MYESQAIYHKTYFGHKIQVLDQEPRQPSYLFPLLQIFLGAAEQVIESAEK